MALDIPPGYRALKEADVAGYLAGVPAVAARLGGAKADWRIREVGDGNLNLVFVVEGPADSVVLKQALPYLRLVGESWPLPLRRAYFEYHALKAEGAIAPEHVPELFHFDETLALTVMAFLRPHIILRKGLIKGVVYPKLADHMATFMARTLFLTSDLGQPAARKKAHMALFCDNVELCRITEDLVFTDPWRVAEANRWTTPQLDATAAAVRADGPWKRAAQELKLKFLGQAQALIHGDLHSGSIMVTENETYAIDPEFAFYGPMGFDVGALIGNLFLAYFAQSGHEARPGARDAYRAWILDTIESVWTLFDRRFRALWTGAHASETFAPALFADAPDALGAAQDDYMRRLFVESLGFAGAKMTRRILGLAHVEDLESIADPDRRAACERRALRQARTLMVEGAAFTGIAAATDAARQLQREAT
ncbi:MAG: S-methyl-5-thioribose kinase [Rhodospirillales bacterium]|nr:MAG: S-methyl-5-thioribose kinase [Rhodospirillales bacterium]